MSDDKEKLDSEELSELKTEILQDEGMYDAAILLFIVIGGVVGVSVFLIGWLALDYLWPSLFFGLLSWILITFGGSWKLQGAKDEHDNMVKEFQEDAEELGISTEQAQKMVNTFVKTMDKVTEDSKN